MNKTKFVEEVSLYLNRSKYDIIKKKHGSVPEILLGPFLEAVYDHRTIPEIARNFSVSIQTINRILRSNFPEVKLLGQRTWKYHFLDCIRYRTCNQCDTIKLKTDFYNSSHGVSGKDSICKDCSNANRKEHAKTNPELHRATGAQTRARKKLAVPKWANKDKIREIYKNCPAGYQVDHIIPLQGKEVCGLHVENNLQYLTKSDNCAKSNKLLEEYKS